MARRLIELDVTPQPGCEREIAIMLQLHHRGALALSSIYIEADDAGGIRVLLPRGSVTGAATGDGCWDVAYLPRVRLEGE